MCAGKDSNLRRPKSGDLQSPLVDHLSTDAFERASFLTHAHFSMIFRAIQTRIRSLLCERLGACANLWCSFFLNMDHDLAFFHCY